MGKRSKADGRVRWMGEWLDPGKEYGKVVHVAPPDPGEESRTATAQMCREMVRDNIEDSLPPEMRLLVEQAERWDGGKFYMAWLYPGRPSLGRTAERMLDSHLGIPGSPWECGRCGRELGPDRFGGMCEKCKGKKKESVR